jgi:ribonuclease HI
MKQIVAPRINKYGDTRRIKWIAFKEGEKMVLGRKRKRVDEEWLIIEHYVEDKETKEVKKCLGCKKNERQVKNSCSRKKNIRQTWSPVVKKIKIEGEKEESQRIINIRTQVGEPSEIRKEEKKNQEKRKKKKKKIEKEEEISIISDAAWDKKEQKGCGVWQMNKKGRKVIGIRKKKAESATQIEIETIIEGLENINGEERVIIISDSETAINFINGNQKTKKYMQRMDKEGAVLAALGKWIEENREIEVKAIKIKEEDMNEEFREVDALSKKELKNSTREVEVREELKDMGIV